MQLCKDGPVVLPVRARPSPKEKARQRKKNNIQKIDKLGCLNKHLVTKICTGLQ